MRNRYYSNRILALLFVISSVFSSTSIVNTDSFGIPLYYLSTIFLALYALTNMNIKIPISVWTLALVVIGGIVLISLLQGMFLPAVSSKQFTQTIFRVVPTVYFLLLFNFAVRNKMTLVPEFLFVVKIVIIYGLYQHFALNHGWPLANNFFANNVSFSTIDLYGTVSGWNSGLRISAIWSEPAGSAVAITCFLTFLLYEKNVSSLRKCIWGALTIIFSYWTYSRILWLSLSVVVGIYVVSKLTSEKSITIFLRRWRYIASATLFIALTWYLNIAMKFSDDLSTLSRSQSVLVGWRVFFTHPFLGIGFGNFNQYSFLYAEMFSEYKTMDLILATFSNYAATLGVIGLVIALTPIYYLLNGNDNNFLLGFTLGCGMLTIGTIGSDIYSSSMIWFIIVMWYMYGQKKDNEIL